MSTLEWAQIRADAIERFNGEVPHAETEAVIIDVFEQRPSVVMRALDEVGEAVSQGKARSGWAVLRARVAGTLEPLRDVSVENDGRERAVRTAETWLHQAGLHFDREDEVEDELFGERGRLRLWRYEEALRARLLAIWRSERPKGEQVEREAVERAQERKATRERVAEAARQALVEAEEGASSEVGHAPEPSTSAGLTGAGAAR